MSRASWERLLAEHATVGMNRCPYCASTERHVKNGRTSSGSQRYWRRGGGRTYALRQSDGVSTGGARRRCGCTWTGAACAGSPGCQGSRDQPGFDERLMLRKGTSAAGPGLSGRALNVGRVRYGDQAPRRNRAAQRRLSPARPSPSAPVDQTDDGNAGARNDRRCDQEHGPR